MATSSQAPFALRARRTIAVLLPAVVIAAMAGCSHHRRSSMRPVYLRPSRACPSGDCGGMVVPSTPSSLPSSSSSSLTPVPSGTTTSEPSLIEPGSGPGASVNEVPPLSSTTSPPIAPAAPRGDRASSGGPALQAPIDEPGLEPAGATEEKLPSASPAPKDPGVGQGAVVPGTSLRSTKGRRTAPTRLRQASFTEQLTPFVNDPDDLFSPPKADKPWKYVVLHHSASPSGGYDSIDREHRERLGWKGCGYHFVIGNGSESPDGRIEVARRWTEQMNGVHCRDGKHPDVNEYGIGICLVGDLEKSPPTERQVAAAQALIGYLRERYKIDADHAETHSHLAASPTSCPGRLFPAQQILGASGLALR